MEAQTLFPSSVVLATAVAQPAGLQYPWKSAVGLSGPGVSLIGAELSKARGLGSSAARWCGVWHASSAGGSPPPLVPKQHHRVVFFSFFLFAYICPASNPMHFGRSLHGLRTMGRRSISRAIGMPGITFDATWPRSWMTATHGLPLGVHSPGARRVRRKSYYVFFDHQESPSQAPTSRAAYYSQQRCTCSSQAPCWGEAPDQAQVASPGRCRAGSQGAGAGSSRGCGPPLWSEKVLTGTPGGPGGATLPAHHGLSRRRWHICQWPSQTL